MKKIFVSCDLPQSTKSIISKYGTISELPSHPDMPDAISSHPDALMVNICDRLFVVGNYDFDIKSVPFATFTNEKPFPKYPHDTLVNCFIISDILFAGKNISSDILMYAEECGIEYVPLNQGYAKCSTLVYKDSIVTSDKGIFEKANNKGIDSLLITQGHIGIKEYDYGFIGGASCVIEDNVIFFGDIRKHPDYISIKEFLIGKGAKVICDDTYELFDYGGIVTINI
ncbi:MAG: hypothetical protein K6F14_05545 [Clostridiales bacterium]|nr:hypothetical protein [Clostridiales bacterium]